VARVVAYVPDLLFGSNVIGMLRAAGHVAVLAPDAERLEREGPGSDLVIIDLTHEAPERVAAVAAVDLVGARTLAFYSHVEADTRALALEAGYDQVVPRSKMAREGPQLVAGLVG
jgi:hypothetical protein